MTSQGWFPMVSVQIWKMHPAFLRTECVLLCTLGRQALVKGRAWGSKADPQPLIIWSLRDIISPLEMSLISLNCAQQEFLKIWLLALRSHRVVGSWFSLIQTWSARCSPAPGFMNLRLAHDLSELPVQGCVTTKALPFFACGAWLGVGSSFACGAGAAAMQEPHGKNAPYLQKQGNPVDLKQNLYCSQMSVCPSQHFSPSDSLSVPSPGLSRGPALGYPSERG